MIKALLLSITLLFTGCGGYDESAPVALERTDLLYGYYGVYGEQVEETRGSINLLFENFWEGEERAIQNMQSAGVPIIFDAAVYLLSPYGQLPRSVTPTAEDNFRKLLLSMRAAGVLRLVYGIVPTDEPNLPENGSMELIPDMVRIIRKVSSEFPELASVRIGCIYFSNTEMKYIELFDFVGTNKYGAGGAILAPGGIYDELEARMRPDQDFIIVPGATYGQPTGPFIEYANRNNRVKLIVPFLWRSPPYEESFTGIHSMDRLRLEYETLGKEISQK